MNYRCIRLRIEGAVATLTLARPDDSNRIDARLVHELQMACEAIAGSDGACVTLVTGEGEDFCAGWRLGEDRRTAEQGEQLGLDPFGPLAALPCPVVAAIQGRCLSAGLELALACDLRIAAEDASFALPEVPQGALPLGGGSQRLPRVVGRSIATAMLLLGDILDAESAYRAGLVSRVFKTATLQSEATALASQIAARGPLALRYAKEAVHQGTQLPLDQALRYELDLSVILQTTRDRAEGVQAFLEKRPPEFEGR